MIKQIVFTEQEWNQFKRKVGIELNKSTQHCYDVTLKCNGENINSDGRGEDWWIGTAIMAIESAENKQNGK
jgi:hypothetical protein